MGLLLGTRRLGSIKHERLEEIEVMKKSAWGLLGIVLLLGGLFAYPIAERIAPSANSYVVIVILLELSALGCGIVATVRGNRWWLALSLIAGLLAAQAVVALLVE
jgi:hypothetical protein